METMKADNTFIKIPKELYRNGVEQMAFNVKGNCMNSPQSPMILKDGDIIVCHRLEVNPQSLDEWAFTTLSGAVGKVLAFMLDDGSFAVKHCIFNLYANKALIFRCYSPQVYTFGVPLSRIKSLFVVDGVVNQPVTERTPRSTGGR